MTNISSPPPNTLIGPAICRIVGFTCLFGFLFDLIALTFPLGSGSAWRISLLQQLGDRSIILMFAIALLLYSFWANRSWRKWMAYASLGIGVLFLLCSILVVRDSLSLKSQALANIRQQASELQSRVEESQSDPDILDQVSPEDFATATRQIDSQAETLEQNAKTTLTKTTVSTTSNFIIVGIGLIGLGRTGMSSSRGNSERRRSQPKQQPG